MAGRVTATANGPMALAAGEQYLPAERRLVDDPLAYRLLPGAGLRLFASLSRWGPWRGFLQRSLGSAVYAGFLCRKRYIDDRLADALDDGLTQVVILGAGFDTRGYRLALPAGAALFEADLPENIDAKRAALHRAYGGVPEGAALVALDFDSGDLGRALADRGYRSDLPAFFVLEAVTQYLAPDGIERTFGFLAGAAPGSRLVFTYVRRSLLEGTEVAPEERKLYQAMNRQWRGLFRFGWAHEETAGFLRGHGWDQREQAGAAEYRERYLRPTGRDLGVLDCERAVYAERIGDATPGA